MTDEKLFRLEQYCDGQGVYETPAPYSPLTRAQQIALEVAANARDRAARHAAAAARELANPTRRAPARACPGRAALFASSSSLRSLGMAQAEHDSVCLPCREDLARAMLAARFDAEVA